MWRTHSCMQCRDSSRHLPNARRLTDPLFIFLRLKIELAQPLLWIFRENLIVQVLWQWRLRLWVEIQIPRFHITRCCLRYVNLPAIVVVFFFKLAHRRLIHLWRVVMDRRARPISVRNIRGTPHIQVIQNLANDLLHAS